MSAQRLSLKGSPTRLKVVIICEDLESGKHAKELHDQLCVALGSNIAFVPEVWTFRALQNPQLQELAAQEISEADMILFSTRGDADPPRWLKSWLETRLSPAARPKALVALFDPAKSPPQIQSTRLYLEDVAAKGRLDFFTERAAPAENQSDGGSASPGSWTDEEHG